VGKSGLIAEKSPATLFQQREPLSFFLPRAEALHGIWECSPEEMLSWAVSYGGETERNCPAVGKALQAVGDAPRHLDRKLHSTLAEASDVALGCEREGKKRVP